MTTVGNTLLKRALCALCRTLPGSGWSPETFRKAKYNRPEVASEFWKLLYCLLQQTYQRNNCSSLANEKKGLENQAKYVKCVLRHQGYGRSAFYDLPCDGSEGSRELLLAFSWLLKKFKLLEKFLELIRVRLDDELDSCVIIQLLESENSHLEAYLEWKQVESVYWQWMESILMSSCDDDQSISEENLNNMAEFICHSFNKDIEDVSNYLADIHNRLQEMLFCKKSAWHQQIKELKRLDEKEVYLTARKNKQEALKKIQDFKHSFQSKETNGQFSLIFNNCFEMQNISFYTNPKSMLAADLIIQLKRAECELETEMQMLQEECRVRLDNIIEQYEGVICIPPSKVHV
ncbi:tubulin epsilon and delta complex protein 1 isoform X2 [Pelobates fuscus]|uniref:tubulin epsilon and delta complex protein 1 isoform X2 n=1 Tax=Pelobates fuscus TaxID=191477 RepID=UPI002FE4ABF6